MHIIQVWHTRRGRITPSTLRACNYSPAHREYTYRWCLYSDAHILCKQKHRAQTQNKTFPHLARAATPAAASLFSCSVQQQTPLRLSSYVRNLHRTQATRINKTRRGGVCARWNNTHLLIKVQARDLSQANCVPNNAILGNNGEVDFNKKTVQSVNGLGLCASRLVGLGIKTKELGA